MVFISLLEGQSYAEWEGFNVRLTADSRFILFGQGLLSEEVYWGKVGNELVNLIRLEV